MAVLVAAVSCGDGPVQTDLVQISGTVFIGSQPAGFADALVYLFEGNANRSLRGITDSDGRYVIAAPAEPRYCELNFVAFSPQTPFPLESGLTPPRSVPATCEGSIAGPDFHLPEPPPELLPVNVSGTLTFGGSPFSGTMRLIVESAVWGPTVIAETQSSADGSYVLAAEVPVYYCPHMRILTVPTASAFQFVAGCFDTTKDVEIG